MQTSPSEETIILSIPLGPNEVLSIFPIAEAANQFAFSA